VARLADPDPWRTDLRQLFRRPRAQARSGLRKQAYDRAALQRQPAASLVLLAELLERAGELDRSREVLRLAWQRFPGDFWVNHWLGSSSSTGERYERPEEAVRYLTAALAARPSSVGAHGNLGLALADLGKLDEAIAIYRQAITIDPKSAQAHTNLGALLCDRNGDYPAAIAAFRKALAVDPQYVSAQFNLGVALNKQGKVDEAIAAFRKAIALDPQDALAYGPLGVLLADHKKDIEGAIAAFRNAVKLHPKDTRSHYSLGICLHRQGKEEEAIAAFRRALSLNPKYALAQVNLGAPLGNLGMLEEAIAAFRQGIALDPKLAAEFNRALQEVQTKATALAKRLRDAEERLTPFLAGKYRPRNNDERLGLAVLCERRRLYPTAARLYADAFAADPRLPEDGKAGRRMQCGPRYDAACCAARAGGGQGENVPRDESERARWRRQALDWMKAELARCGKDMNSWFAATRSKARQALMIWQHDSALASIRDRSALIGLPAEERQACEKFWADVAALLRKRQPGPR
jgi:tetratricopeptide (TPR) repeat protein